MSKDWKKEYKAYARKELERLVVLMPMDKSIWDWTDEEKQISMDFDKLAMKSIRKKNTSVLCEKCNDNMWYGVEECQCSSPLRVALRCDCGHFTYHRLPKHEMVPIDIVIGYKDDE